MATLAVSRNRADTGSMVLAYHLIFTLYGWLPNDPRGSSSHLIRSDVIAELGELHLGRKRIQPSPGEIRDFYDAASQFLKHELKTLDESSVKIVAAAFADVIRQRQYTCYACAIMSDHVHILVRKHRDNAEQMIENLQNQSRLRFHEVKLFRPDHPVWGGPGWKVYLDSADDIWRTIPYIENNPVKMRQPIQRWPFVEAYDGWTMSGAARSQRS